MMRWLRRLWSWTIGHQHATDRVFTPTPAALPPYRALPHQGDDRPVDLLECSLPFEEQLRRRTARALSEELIAFVTSSRKLTEQGLAFEASQTMSSAKELSRMLENLLKGAK